MILKMLENHVLKVCGEVDIQVRNKILELEVAKKVPNLVNPLYFQNVFF